MGTVRITSNCGGTNRVSIVNKETGLERNTVYLGPSRFDGLVKTNSSVELSSQGGTTFIKIEGILPEQFLHRDKRVKIEQS